MTSTTIPGFTSVAFPGENRLRNSSSAAEQRLPSIVNVPSQPQQTAGTDIPRAPRGRSLVRKSSGASRQLNLETIAISAPQKPAASVPDQRDQSPEERPISPHLAHIAKLAQPKKNAPAIPARLLAKKKVVAFGVTTNISQTVEGTSSRNRARDPSSHRPSALARTAEPTQKQNLAVDMENKENQNGKVKAKAISAGSVAAQLPRSTPTTMTPEMKEEVANIVREGQEPLINQLNEKFDELTKMLTQKKTAASSSDNSVCAINGRIAAGREQPWTESPREQDKWKYTDTTRTEERVDDAFVNRIMDNLKRDSDFHRVVSKMCAQTEYLHRPSNVTPRQDLPSARYRDYLDTPPYRTGRLDMGDDRRNDQNLLNRSVRNRETSSPYSEGRDKRPMVNEKVMMMERSYRIERDDARSRPQLLSPHGEPYSVDSENYLHSVMRRTAAPSPLYDRNRRMEPEPQSTYQPGTSKSFYPNHNSNGIVEMPQEDYERQLRQRQMQVCHVVDEPSLDSIAEISAHNVTETPAYWDKLYREKHNK